IPLGSRFWPLSAVEKRETEKLFRREDVRRLVTSLRSRDDDAPISMVDAAYWVKGCSSLGRLWYAALIHVGKPRDKDRSICLIDMKEATRPAAPVYRHATMPRDNGHRVVIGARHLAPVLGSRMLTTRFLD